MPQDLKAYSAILGRESEDAQYSALVPSCRAESELWRYQVELDRLGWSRWAVVAKGDHKLIGYCGFSPYGDDVEMSWRFLPEFRGCGLILEAAEAVTNYGFGTLGFARIISFSVPDNNLAQGVMQQLGMSLECFEGWSSCIVARYSLSSVYTHRL
ncbi:hypothetical protein ACH42_13590 [Endozoicomonas sp. (ex Bugula neritina AB1)]|nr:hypothetical protein ACH42_13590 [Endozoicomonas sp. (ex Bugula neritina AB1)]